MSPLAFLDAERRLALHYVPAPARNALAAIFELDVRLHVIRLKSREPMLAAIKLAWWEERLRGLRTEAVLPEPLLRQLAAASMIDVSDLVRIAEGWRALFADSPSPDVLCEYSRGRGPGLMRAGGAALGREPSEAMLIAGEGYALVDLAASRVDREIVLAAARDRFARAGRIVWPRPLRPIGMIVELARGEAARGSHGRSGSPARVGRMAWHAVTGR